MKALVYHGKNDLRTDTVADPSILDPKDVILKVTATAICGSDLHILDGFTPTMQSGDILGHEFMGEVVELGSAVTKLKKGDRVVIPFTIACGECFFCQKGFTSVCDRSNPNANIAAKAMGHSPSGLYGYSHMLGGFAGGQAEYVRVINADFNAYKVPEGLTDEQVLFLTDIFPTGYMGAENAEIEPGDTVAVWGCGPVGLFAIRSAWMLGAGRVIAIDNVPERLALAETYGKAETINFDADEEVDEHGGGNVYEKLMEMTDGRGPDRCIDAVGTEAHTHGALDAVLDNLKKMTMLGTDRAHVLRMAIYACRKAGNVSVPGVYLGAVDKLPMGAFVNKGLTMKSGQTHVHRYLPILMDKIEKGEIDPSGIITHRGGLDDAPELYKTFRDKKDGCIKCVLTPHESHVHRAA